MSYGAILVCYQGDAQRTQSGRGPGRSQGSETQPAVSAAAAVGLGQSCGYVYGVYRRLIFFLFTTEEQFDDKLVNDLDASTEEMHAYNTQAHALGYLAFLNEHDF